MPAFILISEGLDRSVGSLLFDFGVPMHIIPRIKPSDRDQYVPKGTYIIVNLIQRHISYDIKDPQGIGVWHAENYDHFISLCTLLGEPLPEPLKLHNDIRSRVNKTSKG